MSSLYDATAVHERVYVFKTIPSGLSPDHYLDLLTGVEAAARALGYTVEERSLGHGEVEIYLVRPTARRDD